LTVRRIGIGLVAAGLLAAWQALAAPGDEHWSRQFPEPGAATGLSPGTGMTMAGGKPRVLRVKWRDERLWMAGAWQAGADPTDLKQRHSTAAWHLWTWSPKRGYEPVVHFGQKGGAGPDGQIYDFVWLPDGRLVVGGAFQRVDNPGGTMYHRVNGLAVYDPQEPTADKWRPLGTFQYNGTVNQGHVEALAYDPQGNDLFIGGNFAGIPGANSRHVHRYDFDTASYEPMTPGVLSPKTFVRRIVVDSTTTPSTIYVAGQFHYTAGNGLEPPISDSTSRYTTGLAKWQQGKGWTTFPAAGAKQKEDILQRAEDYKNSDSVSVFDVLVDGDDIWIVGAFSGGKGSGETIRGIAKWDAAKQKWIDPTGKGGVGREAYSIAKASNGKIYVAGAFGGVREGNKHYDGFKNGDRADLVIAYDPATKEWSQLGSGLLSLPTPEVRMTVTGNDVYVVGDFQYIGRGNDKQKDWQSSFIARWNETIDFTQMAPTVANTPPPLVGVPAPTAPLAQGNEHWSRAFPAPGRRKRPDQPTHTAATGMDDGTGMPETRGLAWIGETLYFVGNWAAVPNQRWFVWSWHATRGWEKLAWEEGGQGEGPQAMPNGVKGRDGKLWVYGGLPNYNGLAIYDPEAKTWAPFTGTWNGKPVTGHAVAQDGGAIHDIAWDDQAGDFYMVGASGLENPSYEYPGDVAPVIRVDKDGVYHPMGHDIKPEDPQKPVKRFQTIFIDQSVNPSDIYIGGTFNFYGPTPSAAERMLFNVARWDRAAQDWAPIGKGPPAREVERKFYPDGLPGLPARPTDFTGFLEPLFPRVHALITDAAGNLYAGGSIAVLDSRTLPVADRVESFGIAKWDKATDRWVALTETGGFSRDVIQMSWLDKGKTKLLATGGFEYGNDWTPLNGVAIVDVTTGKVEPLGGGLLLASRDQTVAPMVRHTLRDEEIWFTGLFDHAGVNANALLGAPIPSNYVAMWHPRLNMDPNAGLAVTPPAPLPVAKSSSASANVVLEAKFDGAGTVNWYEKRSQGYAKMGTGATFKTSVRYRRNDTEVVFYVAVSRPDGSEGGKVPVVIRIGE
jgi:hypothetical protein